MRKEDIELLEELEAVRKLESLGFKCEPKRTIFKDALKRIEKDFDEEITDDEYELCVKELRKQYPAFHIERLEYWATKIVSMTRQAESWALSFDDKQDPSVVTFHMTVDHGS